MRSEKREDFFGRGGDGNGAGLLIEVYDALHAFIW